MGPRAVRQRLHRLAGVGRRVPCLRRQVLRLRRRLPLLPPVPLLLLLLLLRWWAAIAGAASKLRRAAEAAAAVWWLLRRRRPAVLLRPTPLLRWRAVLPSPAVLRATIGVAAIGITAAATATVKHRVGVEL